MFTVYSLKVLFSHFVLLLLLLIVSFSIWILSSLAMVIFCCVGSILNDFLWRKQTVSPQTWHRSFVVLFSIQMEIFSVFFRYLHMNCCLRIKLTNIFSLNLSQCCKNKDFLESVSFLVSFVPILLSQNDENDHSRNWIIIYWALNIEHRTLKSWNAERSTMYSCIFKWIKYRSLSTEYFETAKMNEQNKW